MNVMQNLLKAVNAVSAKVTGLTGGYSADIFAAAELSGTQYFCDRKNIGNMRLNCFKIRNAFKI